MTSPNPEKPPLPVVTDRRTHPTGVLPRHLQSWLMAGIAVVILVIILLTGRSQPAPNTPSTPAARQPAVAPAERIRSFERQLAQEEARLLAEARTEAGDSAQISAPRVATPGAVPRPSERGHAVEASSLFADNVALSRRPEGKQPYAERRPPVQASGQPTSLAPSLSDLAQLRQALTNQLQEIPVATGPELPTGTPTAPALNPGSSPSPSASTVNSVAAQASDERAAPGPRYPIVEGTAIETVLINRLDGAMAGPVSCLVTTAVYSHGRDVLLIPGGARVLGDASPVQAWGDSRLAVSFHRLVMPDGHSYSLDGFKGLDQAGESGVRDTVDRHYWQVFGASIAIGALSGLTQFNTRSGVGVNDFGDQYRQAMGANLGSSASRVLDRYLNILPTITVREGHRVHVYLTKDFELPAYQAGSRGSAR